MELREHHGPKRETFNGAQIQLGDIVTVMEEGKSNRGTWKLGKAQDLHPGSNGLVRGATVDAISSKGKRIHRPLQELFPLEGTATEVADASSSNCTPSN